MSHPSSAVRAAFEDRFGQRVAQRLSSGALELPHDLSERLRAARVQAVAKRKPALRPQTSSVVIANGSTAVHGGGWWYSRIGAVVPLIALVAGLFVISAMQDERLASEAAEVDAALLTDDLPPSAFTDPGFAQFVKGDAGLVGR